ncbi:uncharacterized protein TRIADDRAFT_57709 [Trichoplax adhaerens]|uniref:Solute carrier family 23 member 2 n=1 Tax=Trichoplax adhaerens TaxID=10228 RepID=B3S073_TRIAD|nr:hypothetical protein TRIADDRAFT_57709 [Trichoplax adhaerens]EDV23957.1 hypothetical protein TRIADDRAFT_57709 [Trichoplax adhaerens]|eukprot:XP_002113483.1 hypothetical protein TRIADDRAFT_57709 [Trichoplax adhaerens]
MTNNSNHQEELIVESDQREANHSSANQHYLTMFGGTISLPFVVSAPLCIGNNNPLAISDLISTVFFVSGIATLLQVTFGVRLPIVQGASYAFVTPTFAIMSLEKWKSTCSPNTVPWANLTLDQQNNQTEMWQSRIREIQGGIMLASLFQVVIGFTGLVGLCLRFIGPITVACTITLVGLTLVSTATLYASSNWGIAVLTIFFVTLFSQILEKYAVPLPGYQRGKGCYISKAHIFRLFPVLLAIIASWVVSAILTAAGAFTSDRSNPGYFARTDARIAVLETSPWLRFPYPFQWGIPTTSVAGVFGMLAGVLASMIESIGDYYACARLVETRPPPKHAINRGIGMEGIGCVLAGMIGSGAGTTSYSENIGAIGITGVASRAVIQCGSVIMIVLAIVSKFGALFASIPNPVVGGVFVIMFGMVTAVGISNLQFCDMNSPRNVFIVGFSIIFGMAFPTWLSTNSSVIKTTVPELDQIIVVLLSTNMAVGGVTALILDNIIPGTLEERGMRAWFQETENKSGKMTEEYVKEMKKTYDLPFGISEFFRRFTCSSYIPFCAPHYDIEEESEQHRDLEIGKIINTSSV